MISSAIIPQPLARLPWRLIFLVTGITAMGLLTLYSAAGGSMRPWALKQGTTFVFFLCIAVAMSWTRESTIKNLAFPVYGAVLVMLVLVEMLGFVTKGAQRWLDVGFIRLQPSEFMKPAIVLVLARFYELLPAGYIRKWRAIWPAGLLIGVPAALILVQPDLGTCIMVVLGGIDEVDSPVLIEEYIEGREIYAAVLGNSKPEALPLVELDLSKLPDGMPKIAGYEVKFDVNTEAYRKTKSAPARDLDEETTERIHEAAIGAYRALKLRDYGRIDLRLAANGKMYVIEANPNPWLDPAAEFTMAAKESGRSYTQLIGEIVELAMERY
jgi:hypothetical protein